MDERQETRKIQFTGKSSYIVSLPKQWIIELGLKQGDQLRMVRKGSSTLELYPPKFETRLQKKEDATIEIGMEEKAPTIVRKLTYRKKLTDVLFLEDQKDLKDQIEKLGFGDEAIHMRTLQKSVLAWMAAIHGLFCLEE